MQLHRTRQRLHQGFKTAQPREALPHLLQAAPERGALPDQTCSTSIPNCR